MINSVNHNLFPVSVYDRDIDREFTYKEINFISEQKKVAIQNTSNKNSSNKNVLEQKVMKDIKSFCVESLQDYFTNVLLFKDAELYITLSWLNFTENGQSHHIHTHPNSIISGVFYFQSTEDDKIIFKNNKTNAFEFLKKDYNPLNSSTWWLPAKKGKLYLFNSNIEHYVQQRFGQETRISLSFNTFFKGTCGNENDSNLLTLY